VAEVNFLVKKGLTVPKGSASTPSIIFDASDPNTGIYSPAADQLAISTNGTGRLFVDAGGKIGLNTSAPSSQFSVGSDTSAPSVISLDYNPTNTTAASISAYHSNGEVRYGAVAAYFPTFYSNNQERLRITSDGKLGLGTSTVDAKVQIVDTGTAQIRIGYNATDAFAKFGRTSSGTYEISSEEAGAQIRFQTSDSANTPVTALTIDRLQRVGIGTTSPSASALLDVSSTTQGLLPPRMTGAQRDAISSPAAGLMVYNTTTNKLNFYNGTAWEAVTSA